MFNGIIFNTGKVVKILKRKKGINIFIKSHLNLKKKTNWHFHFLRWCLLNIDIYTKQNSRILSFK